MDRVSVAAAAAAPNAAGRQCPGYLKQGAADGGMSAGHSAVQGRVGKGLRWRGATLEQALVDNVEAKVKVQPQQLLNDAQPPALRVVAH